MARRREVGEEMTKTYTAADFANARFAELGKHGLRAHKSAGDSYWQRDGIKRATNEEMADAGWVPVPTKPTLTDSQLEEACGQWYESDDFLMGFMAGYEKAGVRSSLTRNQPTRNYSPESSATLTTGSRSRHPNCSPNT